LFTLYGVPNIWMNNCPKHTKLQSVIKDNNGNLLNAKTIAVQFSIINDSEFTTVYQEDFSSAGFTSIDNSRYSYLMNVRSTKRQNQMYVIRVVISYSEWKT